MFNITNHEVNVDQNKNEIPFYTLLEWLWREKKKEKTENNVFVKPLYMARGNVKWCGHFKNNLATKK